MPLLRRSSLIGAAAAAAVLLSSPGARGQAKLDTTQFVVVGEGLAAGMADFGLREVYQERNFPSQMARQMKTAFPQPIMESPGIGNVPGFPQVPPRLPNTLQGSVRTPFPPGLFVFNLSVPGFKLADTLNRRPLPPVVQPRDPQQTVTNMILGYPALILGTDKPLWSQVDYAINMNPTLVLVELGYYEVLDAAVNNDPSRLPDVTAFRTNFNTILTRLKATNAQIVVLNIPDPMDTAYFTTVQAATPFVGTPPDQLMKIFRLNSTDLITPFGMMLIGNLILSNDVSQLLNPLFPGLGPYFSGTVVSGATSTAVRSRVIALNTEIANAAKAAGAQLYDLQGLFARIRARGLQAGSRTLTADFLGGFYSLDGFYPGVVGHGLIANELLSLLNTTYKTSFPLLDLNKLAEDDPAGRFTPAYLSTSGREALQ